MHRNAVRLGFAREAEDAARFHAATVPDSQVTAIQRARTDYPCGKAGDVPTVERTVAGVPGIGLDGGAERPGGDRTSLTRAP